MGVTVWRCSGFVLLGFVCVIFASRDHRLGRHHNTSSHISNRTNAATSSMSPLAVELSSLRLREPTDRGNTQEKATERSVDTAPENEPIRGVQYAPHLLGEPRPDAYTKAIDMYTSVYKDQHRKQLKLIAASLGANTLRLNPWNNEEVHTSTLESSRMRTPFYQAMQDYSIKNLIPTFQLSKYYYEAMRDKTLFDTDPNTPFAMDFKHFQSSIQELDTANNPKLRAWSLDIALRVQDMWVKIEDSGTDCKEAKPPNGVDGPSSLQLYISLLRAIGGWVWPSESFAPASMKNAPLLIPLDFTEVGGESWERAKQTAVCLTDWLNTAYVQDQNGLFKSGHAHWLFAFTMPLPYLDDTFAIKSDCAEDPKCKGFVDDTFVEYVKGLVNDPNLDANMMVMLGTQALTYDHGLEYGQIVEDAGNQHHPLAQQQMMLRYAFTEYSKLENENKDKLHGILLDEWMDDWDRGARGPFAIAGRGPEIQCGSRFTQEKLECRRPVSMQDGREAYVYPEALGLAASMSKAFYHCARPRFSKAVKLLGDETTSALEGDAEAMVCATTNPAWTWVIFFSALLLLAMAIHLFRAFMRMRQVVNRTQTREPSQVQPLQAAAPPGTPLGEPQDAKMVIAPARTTLQGGHSIVLRSRRFSDEHVAEWWLDCHCHTQMSILEKQLAAEVLALQAARARMAQVSHGNPELSNVSEEGELVEATRTLHCRTLEGYAAWCKYLACNSPNGGSLLEIVNSFMPGAQQTKQAPQLFAECVLQRTLESLAEHVMHAPERLAYILHQVLQAAEDGHMTTPTMIAQRTYAVDLELLQDGLQRMMANSNPYRLKDVSFDYPGQSETKFERGLNFDDINESGIQGRDRVKKTFAESMSIWVVVDLVLQYRVLFSIKYGCFILAFYFYLGSSTGNDSTTRYNGSFFEPQYARLDLWFYGGLADAVIWSILELLIVTYWTWQRWPSWGTGSPGAPNLCWVLQHVAALLLSLLGCASLIFCCSNETYIVERKASCAEMSWGECIDPRVQHDDQYSFQMLLSVLAVPLAYWLHRFVTFSFLHRRRWPVFIHGSPWTRQRANWSKEGRVAVMWIFMLICCVCFEAYILLPATAGLNWKRSCGLELLSSSNTTGVCTNDVLNSTCMPCLLSIVCVWLLVFICMFLDVYFVFYICTAIVGFGMGIHRELNNMKFKLTVDLRPPSSTFETEIGRHYELFMHLFGGGWRRVWLSIVKDLYQESLMGKREAKGLLEAAGLQLGDLIANDPVLDEPHITRGGELDVAAQLGNCKVAAERITFFFRSLTSFKRKRHEGDDFRPTVDAMTAEQFHVGSITPLTMIIPVYNETVVPTAGFLKDGGRLSDARNQRDNLGERMAPPRGDGANTNLAFLISQFQQEWVFMAERQGSNPSDLYKSFIAGHASPEQEQSIRMWAALRTQSVAKTVLGALKYPAALAALPAMQQHYSRYHASKRVPEMHAEVLLAHQTFGSSQGSDENDVAVRMLLKEHSHLPFYLVIDFRPESGLQVRQMVQRFLNHKFPGKASAFLDTGMLKYARCKCFWDPATDDVQIMELLPRIFQLRVGSEDAFLAQGKASNQLNALLFASGHCVQALDSNMGAFIGECFKVPYILRDFLPPPRHETEQSESQHSNCRSRVRCRFIGFREFIFTGRHGTVGKHHAGAEWTFGTIYQRFLSALAIRMHYGHPDFLDAFWARNRGGMSKCSPMVNLSEDIFAGYNVTMRGERSPHVDSLEYEKGRETTFNAASGFFAKVAGGSVSLIRSRDNRLLCENLGIFHNLSFYFASICFYFSNLLVDLTVYLYVVVFICFTLASISLGYLKEMGSMLGTEWVLSMGLVSMFPQFFELLMEYGAFRAVWKMATSLVSGTVFFIFQNKNIAEAMKAGILSGTAKYISTGRPMANQHQTWKDIYIFYWKSHFHPAFDLLGLYLVYTSLVEQTNGGHLPMALVIASFTTWLTAPLLFSPLPRQKLAQRDLLDFASFVSGKAGMDDPLEVVLARASKKKYRSLYELGIAHTMNEWSEQPLQINLLLLPLRLGALTLVFFTLPAAVLDFLAPFFAVLGLQWLLTALFFKFNHNNVFMFLTIPVWLIVPLVGIPLIGDRATTPKLVTRLPEYLIALLVYMATMACLKRLLLILVTLVHAIRAACFRAKQEDLEREFKMTVRACYFFFFEHQTRTIRAYMIIVINIIVSTFLVLLDCRCFGVRLHTMWLLNSHVAKASPDHSFMEGTQRPSFILDQSMNQSFGSSVVSFFRSRGDRRHGRPTNPQDGEAHLQELQGSRGIRRLMRSHPPLGSTSSRSGGANSNTSAPQQLQHQQHHIGKPPLPAGRRPLPEPSGTSGMD